MINRHVAYAEHASLVPRTHAGWLTIAYNQFQGMQLPPLASEFT